MTAAASGSGPILDVRDLSVEFGSGSGAVRAVDHVSLTLRQGQTVGIVGESGSGKSVTALAMLRLIPSPPGRIVSGQVLLDNVDLLSLDARAIRGVRGDRVSMIFQDPMTSLNPVFTVGAQVAEVFRIHRHVSRRDAYALAERMLNSVGIPDAKRRLDEYPHQLSGGMRQRVMIAMALGCEPKVLLADEPTTALDVTIQAQIVELLQELQERTATGIVLISHDMGLIAEMCDRVLVMYAGRIVEEAPAGELFAEPRHPYTRGLLESLPRLRTDPGEPKLSRLPAIAGIVPDLARLPRGCAFRPRCRYAIAACGAETPPLATMPDGRKVSCWLYESEGAAVPPEAPALAAAPAR